MNIEAYDLDSLRKIVRALQKENEALKSQLKKADIAFDDFNPFEETIESINDYDPDQGERILGRYITENLARRFFAMFWGREDVYAKRGRKGGYFPQCDNRWNDTLCPKQQGEKVFCDDCENTKWTKLNLKKIVSHLVGKKEDGTDVIGVYPLLPDGTCRFIVFDFDNHDKDAEKTDFANTDDEWHNEVDALRKMCEQNGIKSLVERSRSGRGAHVWIFFKKPIAASLARNFGFLLLDKGSASINMKSFHYYDRMYPSQDVVSGIGNLIALPLQGQADPLFFNLSYAEAELMDPQQRKFLEESWKAIEDAGYSPEDMYGKNCGVFVGALTGDYMMLTKTSRKPLNALFLTGSGNSFISARIAYLLNLKGPNMSIDTACSSSLVAIYEAYKSIVTKECEMALTGGVCIMSTPDMHLTTSKAGLLSPSGVCKVFDNAADGIAIGEGVGVIVLKPLAKALEDHDHIYGVIKGGLVNQDGKTNGLTSPSAHSQTQLEIDCYQKYNINPENINYIECHGTGTKLGDPIEISALTKAFEHYTNKKQFCRVGSVKANIGHGLASSGIAGMIKVILSLQNRKIVPSIHYQKKNHLIHFEDSPFTVNTKLIDWETDGKERIAAVSSFGLSGTNCHMVLGEAPQVSYSNKDNSSKKLFVISAKTETAFEQKISDLISWFHEKGSQYRLQDVGYTLLNGRKHFPIRAAIIARTREELVERLHMLSKNMNHPDIIIGNLYKNVYFTDDDEIESTDKGKSKIDEISGTNSLENLVSIAEQYCAGKSIPNNELYIGEICYRISLPSYPFEKDTMWIQRETQVNDFFEKSKALHPLIDSNISTLEEQCFKKTFTRQDYCISEHVIRGEMVLPGAAYLEMAYHAAELASKELFVRRLRDIVWEKSLILEEDRKEVFINFYEENHEICFSIFSKQLDESLLIHARGKVEYGEKSLIENKRFDISKIQEQCKEMEVGESFYDGFANLGLSLGLPFQTVRELYGNAHEVLAKIQLNANLQKDIESFTLHPGMLDGALQAAAGLVMDKMGGKDAMYLPFRLNEFEVYKPLTKTAYSYIIPNDERSSDQEVYFNVYIMDEQGYLLAELREVVGRLVIKPETNTKIDLEEIDIKRDKKERVADLLIQLENGEIDADEVNRILEEM